jgi:hypothetical protein
LTPGGEATVDQAVFSTSPSEDMIRFLYADDEESRATDAKKALEKHD